ncbi:MAG: hypothetical protein LBS01_02505 [Prevotellaceae bacterium]|jgi:hypothetical protein|nr:hypothetical protein [Prevotellaceae bacterium]
MNKRPLKTFSLICLLSVFCVPCSNGQDIDLENIGGQVKEVLKKNPFKISGGLSASGIYYNSNLQNNREPFTYFLNGNVNIGIYNWAIPVSYTFTNQGSTLGYQLPYKFNRLSINPKYKWVQAHIGDVNMSFSPYIFSGMPFTGAGVELTPNIPLKVAVFGGQFSKAINDDEDPRTMPAFLRWGYGAQIRWEKQRYKLGITGFYAKDNLNSLDSIPYSKQIFPQENMTFLFNANIMILKNLELFGEYSRTGITDDLTAIETQKSKDPMAWFLKENTSTQYYQAYNAGINYSFGIGQAGIRYERIDPNYRTLGAYYFNSDFENMTLNLNFNLLSGKLTFGGNIGRQRDNLKADNEKQTERWVASANLSWQISERLNIAGNYSNFTSFTNNRLNQFDKINQNPLETPQPLDSITYRQISQNASANIQLVLSQNESLSQNLLLNYSLSDMVNRENDIVRKGGLSRFHNSSISHSIEFKKIKLKATTSVNYTNSYAASQKMYIWGPSLNVTQTLLKDKMNLSLGGSYNRSTNPTAQTDVTNLRLGANYSPWKRHSFNLSAVQMFKKSTQGNIPEQRELNVQLGYAFSF